MRKRFNKWYVLALWLGMVAAVAAQETATPAVPRTGSPRSKEIAGQLQALISQSPEEMAEMARKLAGPLLADLRYERAIVQLQTRERRMEEARIKLLASADEKAAKFQDARQELEAEVERLRRQFADDPGQLEEELRAVALLGRERLLSLKASEKQHRRLAQETDGELGGLRIELATLERQRRAFRQKHEQVETDLATPRVWGLGIRPHAVEVGDRFAPKEKGKASQPKPESYDNVMKSLEGL